MRGALDALTTRGRAFLSAGVTALVCSLALGLGDLTRVGALLVALPLLAAFVVTRGRQRLGLRRVATPGLVAVGAPATVQLTLSNEGRTPTGLLLLEEQVPYALGTRPRFVIDKMGSRWRREVDYVVRSEVRGRFQLGPLLVRATDPFGLVELDRTFATTSTLVVTPRVVPLPAIPLDGSWTGSGDNRPRDFAGGSAEDVTTREYRRGDDLRRVHWRSSAHAGELMVRREEQPWQSRATVFVDNRAHVHRGHGPASSLEDAVSIAASVAVHLSQRGFRVRLVTADGHGSGQNWHEHGAVRTEIGPLLESLAVLEPVERAALDLSWLNESPSNGLLVAVLGAVQSPDAAALRRMRHGARTPMAVTLDVHRWPGGQDEERPDAAVRLLRAQGWRAASAAPGESLSQIWQALGLARRDAAGQRVGALP